MSSDDPERQVSIREQRRMFRLAARDHGLDRAALHLETHIPDATLKSWGCTASDKVAFAVIPLSGLRKLLRVIPDELTSLLFAGTGKHVGTDELGEGDLDSLGREAAGYVAEKLEREADGIVCHIDRAALQNRARRVCAVARRAAA